MTLPTGHIVKDRYRIASVLGEGGMSIVYRAWHLNLQVPVILKEMIPQGTADGRFLEHWKEQFQLEAHVLAKLDHPNLVDVVDYFQEAGKTYLVMRFVEGQSLQSIISKEGPLPEAQVREWALQLLDALDYCHNQGVAHRDIKPANIIIRPDGQAVLVDFGLVKLLDPTDPRTRTIMMNMGTPEYAPPEQYDAQPGHTGPWSDVYSMGATLYHALSGQAPPTASQRMVVPEELKRLRSLNPQINAQTEAVILRSMAMERNKRYPDAATMATALTTQKRRYLAAVVTGVIVILLIVLGIVGWQLLAQKKPPARPTGTAAIAGNPTITPPETAVSPIPARVTEMLQPTVTTQPTKTPTILPISTTPVASTKVTASRPNEQELRVFESIWSRTTFVDMELPGVQEYFVPVQTSDRLRWSLAWCASNPSRLSEILAPLTVRFLIDGKTLTNSKLAQYDLTESNGWRCHYWSTILHSWDQGEQIALEISYNLNQAIYDGRATYEPGDYRQVIYAQVN